MIDASTELSSPVLGSWVPLETTVAVAVAFAVGLVSQVGVAFGPAGHIDAAARTWMEYGSVAPAVRPDVLEHLNPPVAVTHPSGLETKLRPVGSATVAV